ncbi:hypothetical protein DFH07DRAFT_732775 [Mycena maculata]|uniref:Mediator complex subunit 16 C-terminal domain-containing protein n=1 Tax=Mycena maculata TaxID=230809 RepID=A0AAD7JYA8_9AGAR|nr:hypothetical protein DFH07DRAFT_732775 [Mycena maculata]
MISSKGKGKEETQWFSGWWEYQALLDRIQRPVAWSSTSTIFSAHPTQPLVTARHFSSSKQFVLQSPGPILSSPGSYEPPTVLSVSPGGDWLFAYFPSGEIDGVACLWQRGAPIDVWGIKEWWTLNRGGGIVAANWLDGPREWTVDDAGSPTRLPPRGPRAAMSNPTLILVTENRWVTLCYLRAYQPSVKMITCSLTEPGTLAESQPNPLEQGTRPGSVRICTRAAVCFAYNGADSSLNSMNLALPLNLEMPSSEPESPIEWDNWGEDSCIELCEVRISYDSFNIVMSTMPLPPIHGPCMGLTNLTFISTPPSPRDVTEMAQTDTYLAASYLDFGDYTSTPKSELVLHAVSRVSEPIASPGKEARLWKTRHFTDTVLSFMASNTSGQSPNTFGLFVGILNSSGPLPREKNFKEIAIGVTKVLKLPDLSDHDLWEPAHIMSSIDSAGRDLPLNAAISFNNSMLLCTTLTCIGPSRISLHILPKPAKAPASSGLPVVSFFLLSMLNILGSTPPLALGLATGLLSGTSITDLSHILALPSASLDEVSGTLFHALILAENGQDKGTLTWRALGLVLETYRQVTVSLRSSLLMESRMRAVKVDSETEREILEARWQTALDMCSLASCNAAFEDCKDGDAFDLDAVWQLVGLSTWVVGFVEKLLKECVLASDLTGPRPQGDRNDLLRTDFLAYPGFETQLSSILLHLAHPYALRSLHAALSNVIRFKNKIGSLSASEENSQIAKNVLVDLIDCSGVDLNALEPLLADLLAETKNFGVEDTRRSLALCEPTSAMGSHLRNAINKVAYAPIVDKPRLFVKPFELMDGVPQILDGRKGRVKDVVSKGSLSGRAQGVICLRCGGKSEIGGGINAAGHTSERWRAWEKMWTRHCICGGAWVLATLKP